MLYYKLVPLESAATTSFITLYLSTTSFLQYIILNSITWDYSIVFIFILHLL